MTLTVEAISKVLQTYIDPYLNQDLITGRAIRNIQLQENNLSLDIALGYPIGAESATIELQIKKVLANAFPHLSCSINLKSRIEPRVVQAGLKSIAGIKNIIAVASGKGGVGKSTTTVNLALALAAKGAKVGILDADIYGPNIPQMLGLSEIKAEQVAKKLQPVENFGIQSMSIAYLIDTKTPVVWRGPMVTSALTQLLHDTDWQDLDYLFIDLPPGTGDIQLTLAQKIPVCGGIIVTTPQDVALLDARKGIEMFNKVRIPILGIVENMSIHICNHCGAKDAIFGEGGGQKVAEEYHTTLLGKLPLQHLIRACSDQGKPIVIAEPNDEISKMYSEIALKAAALLSLQAKDFTAQFPKIVIENT